MPYLGVFCGTSRVCVCVCVCVWLLGRVHGKMVRGSEDGEFGVGLWDICLLLREKERGREGGRERSKNHGSKMGPKKWDQDTNKHQAWDSGDGQGIYCIPVQQQRHKQTATVLRVNFYTQTQTHTHTHTRVHSAPLSAAHDKAPLFPK